MSTEQQLQTLAHELGTALQRITALENTLGCLTMLAMRQLPANQRATWGMALRPWPPQPKNMGTSPALLC